ncbi:phage portal protein [Gordonia sp. ABSL11-1]|uniref:phage portal protein n=1 Tax=Gordonia sp. ABSL11-1 TaxID=3053924 RepID=UPI00257396A6|nr:phage portal protein [Gordonia sp. ABSL11-1]MDL9944185.1 phage portal protein [Gordonia sp. ABSL11-1]
MVAFQSLGELSSWMGTRPDVEIVDPGIPLTDFFNNEVPSLSALRKHPSVRKVTQFIARAVASVPFHTFERISDTDRQRITDHPLAQAMSSPQPRVFPYRFWNNVMMDQLLYDKFCVVWSQDPTTDEITLVRVPAKRFTIKADDNTGAIKEIRTTSSEGRTVVLDPERCIVDAGYSPEGHNGLSPLTTMRDILAETIEAVEYRRSLWRNGARVGQVVTRPQNTPWADGARARFRRSLDNYRAGGGAEGRFLLLEDGMEMKSVEAFKPSDTQDLEGRREAEILISSCYFVPPELVGAREGTYSNIEAFRQMLYRDVAGPWIVTFEQAINAQLTPIVADGRPLYVEANIDAKLRGSFEEQAQIMQTATGAPWLTRNEARARQNLPPVDGGDELVVPLNVLIGNQASPTDSAPDKQGVDQ